MLTVHHLNNSRSQRILWLLEELGAEYEIAFYQRDEATQRAPESLTKVHPLGKSPVITDGGRTIAESGAIIDYIIRRARTPPLRVSLPRGRGRPYSRMDRSRCSSSTTSTIPAHSACCGCWRSLAFLTR